MCRRAAASNLRMALHKHVSAILYAEARALRLMKTDIAKRKTTQTRLQLDNALQRNMWPE